MRQMRLFSILFLCGLIAACTPVPTKTFTAAYGPEFKAFEGNGTSTLTGQAFMRQQGGGVVVCAGEEVILVPYAGFVGQAFDAAKSGIRPVIAGSEGQRVSATVNADPRFAAVARRAKCDAQGNFKFDSVPQGKWIVSTYVRWVIANAQQDSSVGAVVDLSPNNTTTVLLTDADRV